MEDSLAAPREEGIAYTRTGRATRQLGAAAIGAPQNRAVDSLVKPIEVSVEELLRDYSCENLCFAVSFSLFVMLATVFLAGFFIASYMNTYYAVVDHVEQFVDQ